MTNTVTMAHPGLIFLHSVTSGPRPFQASQVSSVCQPSEVIIMTAVVLSLRISLSGGFREPLQISQSPDAQIP
jgi:hypothetical protein